MSEEWARAGLALQGLSAGMQGQGVQFNQQLLEQKKFKEEQDIERRKTVFTDSLSALQFAKSDRWDQVLKIGQSRLEMSKNFPGADFKDTQLLVQMAEMAVQGNKEAQGNLTKTFENNVEIGRGLGFIEKGTETKNQFGGMVTFKDKEDNLFLGTTRMNPQTGSVEAVVTPVQGTAEPIGKLQMVDPMGLTPAQRVLLKGQEAAAVTGATLGAQLEGEPKVAAAVEAAKLTAQLTGKPKVDAAVKAAVLAATSTAGQKDEARSNQRAFDVYTTGITSLASAFDETWTGPGVGWIPALSSNQQIADGALAAMAPILKQMFRASGEGTFTKDDQEILMAMLPSRKDRPTARVAKLANVDAIVRSKLGISGEPKSLPKTNDKGWPLMTDAAKNQAYVGPNGEIEEVQ